MLTAEQFAKHLRGLGYKITAEGVRWHSRKGRCGRRFGDQAGAPWSYDVEKDVPAIEKYLGRLGRPPGGES